MKNSIGKKEDQGSRGALERIEQLKEDKGDLYRRAPSLEDGRSFRGKGGSLGSFEGHREEAQTTLDNLDDQIRAYDKKGCGATYKKLPAKAREIARSSVPSNPNRK